MAFLQLLRCNSSAAPLRYALLLSAMHRISVEAAAEGRSSFAKADWFAHAWPIIFVFVVLVAVGYCAYKLTKKCWVSVAEKCCRECHPLKPTTQVNPKCDACGRVSQFQCQKCYVQFCRRCAPAEALPGAEVEGDVAAQEHRTSQRTSQLSSQLGLDAPRLLGAIVPSGPSKKALEAKGRRDSSRSIEACAKARSSLTSQIIGAIVPSGPSKEALEAKGRRDSSRSLEASAKVRSSLASKSRLSSVSPVTSAGSVSLPSRPTRFTSPGFPAKEDIPQRLGAIGSGSMDVDTKDKIGNTTLYCAAAHGQDDIVRYLLQKCANVNMLNECNNTALHAAALNNQVGVTHILLGAGADTSVNNGISYTAQGLAQEWGMHDVAICLRRWEEEHENGSCGISHELDGCADAEADAESDKKVPQDDCLDAMKSNRASAKRGGKNGPKRRVSLSDWISGDPLA